MLIPLVDFEAGLSVLIQPIPFKRSLSYHETIGRQTVFNFHVCRRGVCVDARLYFKLMIHILIKDFT